MRKEKNTLQVHIKEYNGLLQAFSLPGEITQLMGKLSSWPWTVQGKYVIHYKLHS